MIFELLKEPFPVEKISWRVGATNKEKTKGIALAYIDARDVMDRLDDVVGPGNWQCRYPFEGCCEIGIKITTGIGYEWAWKSNGVGRVISRDQARQEEQEMDAKAQYSDAFKRAAVLWGIGRYLYDLPNEWVNIEPAGRSYKLAITPKLPDWATPYPKEIKAAIDRHTDTITAIKDGIREGNLDMAAEAWYELTKEEKASLWVSERRGGAFTAHERTVMQSTEFKEAHYGTDK